MRMYNKTLFLLSLSTLIYTALLPAYALSSVSKDNPELTSIIRRVDSLEKQIKILEANLPKRIRKLPLDLPNLTSNGAIQETMTRLYDMFNLNFIEYREQINNNRQFCSDEGFEQYSNFLNKSKWLDEFKKKKMLLYIRPTHAPKIIKEGAQDNRYSWLIEVPFTATLENINEKKEQKMIATILVQRASELAHPLGVLVTSIEFKEASS